ncbi:MAG TPA: hypothetical protein VFT97_07570, partial [Candidatus Eisenbacteria bacterium]|nr:hypothetical protein [Candidatus Eisenbacteria bacterium]
MTVAEADSATQTVRASDPEGQVITLVQTHGPAFMTFASTPSAAEATGQVVLRPGYGDAGVSSATILATDGLLTDQLSFEITVLNRNRPPVLEPIADLQAEVGLTTEVGIVASDPDGTALTIGYTGPSFSYLDAHSVIRIAPSVYDAVGGYPATVTASDGEATVSRGFTITVVHTLHAPVVEPVQNMVVTEGDTLFQDVRAYDPDGDALGFEPIGFPPFMHLDPLPSKPPDASARIVIEPRPGDAGVLSLGLRVLDGVFHTEVYFQVTVLAAPHGSTLLELSHAPELPDIPWQTIRFDDSEGTFQVSGSPQTGVNILFAALDDPNEVQLACLPAQRAECVSDPLHMWWLKFRPPTGHPLVPGVYPVASEVPDAEHAGFEVTRLCGGLSTCAVSGVEFEVKEIAFASTGEVSSFWATFHQQCSNEASRIWGEVRYQATPQVYLQAPSRTRAHAGAPLTIDMKVSGSVPGPYTLVSSDLPAGAALTLHDDGTAEIQWTPDLEQQGLYDIHLIAGVADATPDTTELLVCVDIPGAVTATMDANRTRVITTNRGDAAFDALQNAPGAFHPGGSTIPIARSIELMVGATVQGETRLALGNYDQDFAPGPMRNGEAAPFELRFKNYTIRSASPYGYDWEHWPVDLGAPVDETGQPRVLGDATIWSIYNDAAPHPSPRLTAPLGIEVRQTTWARSSPEPVGDVVYQEYRIRNGNSVPLEGVYAGWLVDAITISYGGGHVGIPSRDAVGCDTTLAMGYAYSATYYGEPNAVGLVLIQAPPDGQIPLAAVQERGYPSGAQA